MEKKELVQAKEILLLCAFFLQLVIAGNLQLTKLGQLIGCRFLQGSAIQIAVHLLQELPPYL